METDIEWKVTMQLHFSCHVSIIL